jgi:hypothetical protein
MIIEEITLNAATSIKAVVRLLPIDHPHRNALQGGANVVGSGIDPVRVGNHHLDLRSGSRQLKEHLSGLDG